MTRAVTMRPTTVPASVWQPPVVAFVRTLAFEATPARGRAQAQRCLLDLIGVAAGGSRAPAATVINRYAVSQMASVDVGARLLLDGRRASVAGAGFAGAATIDALDAHDGHVLTKGHAGVAVSAGACSPRSMAVRAATAAEFLACRRARL